MAYSGHNSSDEDDSEKEEGDLLTDLHHQVPPLTEGENTELHREGFILLFLIGRQLKQFVDIITVNASHHTKSDHAYVLEVHFSKSTIKSDVTAASAKRQKV